MTWEEKRVRNRKMLKLWHKGITCQAIAKRFHLTPNRVRVICKTGGAVARRSRGDLMAKARKAGMTYQAIANLFGVTRQAVHSAVKSRPAWNTNPQDACARLSANRRVA